MTDAPPLDRSQPALAQGDPVTVSDAAPAIAARLARALEARGLAVEVAPMPHAQTGAFILTDGLLEAGDPLALHQAALARVQGFLPALEAGALLIGLQDSGGRFADGPSGGWLAGLSGLVKTVAAEVPQASARVIDLPGETSDLERLVDEICFGQAQEIALAPGGERLKPTLTPLRPSPARMAEAGTYLVTGGGRGVTAACVIELARRAGGTFALAGRSPLKPWPEGIAPDAEETRLRADLARRSGAAGAKPSPRAIAAEARALLASREVRETLSAIEVAGGRAGYFACDIADAGQARALVRAAEQRFGPITGLIHGAGVIADKALADKTPDQMERVFAPKVTGLANLLAAKRPDTLREIALFSSAAARFGNRGQADYAMANEILNRIAHGLARAYPALQVKSIGWGPWAGGMVTGALQAHFAARSIELIELEAGARVFCDLLLGTGRDIVEVCVGGEL